LPASQYREWIGFLRDEFVNSEQVVHRKRSLAGEVRHTLLSFIGNIKAANVEEVIENALKVTELTYPQINDLAEHGDSLRDLLSVRELLPFFKVEDGEVFNEREVVNARGETRRIDRLIVKPREVWVIDYKSSRGEGDVFHKQVRGYMMILQDIFPQKEIKGFLIYLDEMKREEVKVPKKGTSRP